MLMIEIPMEEYHELLRRSEKLECLENCGVDNWSGYGDAMTMMEEEY
ncbi:hypothetical protein MKY96_33005 [Paenibacillus sp. FSL R7-0302]